MFDFSDPEFAARFRDTIRQMVADEVDKLRPRTRYGTVQAIDLANRKCLVILNGDEEPVPVSFGTLAPAVVGQIVRVGGVPGDKYVEDVMGVSMGNWRTFDSHLNSNWDLGVGGSVNVKYCIIGSCCTVSWEVRFGTSPGGGDASSLLEIKLPFNHEPTRTSVGVATGYGLYNRYTFASVISDGYLSLYTEASPGGVMAGDPLTLSEYTVFAGTHTYEVWALDLYLHTLWNIPLPGN